MTIGIRNRAWKSPRPTASVGPLALRSAVSRAPRRRWSQPTAPLIGPPEMVANRSHWGGNGWAGHSESWLQDHKAAAALLCGELRKVLNKTLVLPGLPAPSE